MTVTNPCASPKAPRLLICLWTSAPSEYPCRSITSGTGADPVVPGGTWRYHHRSAPSTVSVCFVSPAGTAATHPADLAFTGAPGSLVVPAFAADGFVAVEP